MNLHLSIGPLMSLIAGILILIVPRLLNYIVAIYLIVIGLLGLFVCDDRAEHPSVTGPGSRTSTARLPATTRPHAAR